MIQDLTIAIPAREITEMNLLRAWSKVCCTVPNGGTVDPTLRMDYAVTNHSSGSSDWIKKRAKTIFEYASPTVCVPVLFPGEAITRDKTKINNDSSQEIIYLNASSTSNSSSSMSIECSNNVITLDSDDDDNMIKSSFVESITSSCLKVPELKSSTVKESKVEASTLVGSKISTKTAEIRTEASAVGESMFKSSTVTTQNTLGTNTTKRRTNMVMESIPEATMVAGSKTAGASKVPFKNVVTRPFAAKMAKERTVDPASMVSAKIIKASTDSSISMSLDDSSYRQNFSESLTKTVINLESDDDINSCSYVHNKKIITIESDDEREVPSDLSCTAIVQKPNNIKQSSDKCFSSNNMYRKRQELKIDGSIKKRNNHLGWTLIEPNRYFWKDKKIGERFCQRV